MLVVLDTLVLVSGLLGADPLATRIADLLRGDKLRLAVDDRVLRDYREVLARPFFHRYFKEEEATRVIRFLQADARKCVCTERIELPDPADACFAETALAADAPLVTSDFTRFPAERCGRTRVFAPIRFLEEFHRPGRFG
jgi:putative PIN family toxin of toxin-antitoxin system